MRVKHYKTKSLKISAVALILMLGILVGAFSVYEGYAKRLNEIQGKLETTERNLQEAVEKAQYEYEVNELLEMDLAEAQETIYNLKNEEYEFVYMGDFKITYYCNEQYEHICGGNGVTASGAQTEVGITAAADWSVLPNGSEIYIEGIGFRTIQDVGGAVNGNHIDVLVETHNDAISLGMDDGGVWLLVRKAS